jgi:hypothetical protein
MVVEVGMYEIHTAAAGQLVRTGSRKFTRDKTVYARRKNNDSPPLSPPFPPSMAADDSGRATMRRPTGRETEGW